MAVNILVFGQITDVIKDTRLIISDVKTTDELRQKLSEQFPGLAVINYVIAINKKTIQGNEALSDNDTVALLPPFSGG